MKLASLSFLMFFAVSPLYLSASDHYVAVNGSDYADGSSASPWATITHAGTKVAPGDVVHVSPGIYNFNTTSNSAISTSKSGTPSARIRYISDVPWGAVIIATGANTVWSASGNYFDIIGFDISSTDDGQAGRNRQGISVKGSYVLVAGNHVHNIPATGQCKAGVALLSSGAGGITMNSYTAHDDDTIGNWVENIGNRNDPCSTVHGIYQSNLGGHIYNNVSMNNQGTGIHTWHAATHVTIANNTVLNNGRDGIAMGAGDKGCGTGCSNDYTVVSNNISAYNVRYGLYETGLTGPHNVYSHNLLFSNARGDYHLRNNLVPTASVNADPRFINYLGAENSNLHLQATSSAIGQGTQAAPAGSVNPGVSPTLDFDYVARPLWDLGAFQYIP